MSFPLRVVAAALIEDQRVLAARRALHVARGGLWELPGGKVEPGEDDLSALKRELREELGVEVHVGPALGRVVHPYPERTIELVAYVVRLKRGQPRAREHLELRWLPAARLREVEWAPADLPLLDPLARHLQAPPGAPL